MSHRRKAYILIVIGIIIALAPLPFLSGHKPDAGWFSTLMNLSIHFSPAFAVPYRFILAFGIFLIFVGVRLLDLWRPKK